MSLHVSSLLFCHLKTRLGPSLLNASVLVLSAFGSHSVFAQDEQASEPPFTLIADLYAVYEARQDLQDPQAPLTLDYQSFADSLGLQPLSIEQLSVDGDSCGESCDVVRLTGGERTAIIAYNESEQAQTFLLNDGREFNVQVQGAFIALQGFNSRISIADFGGMLISESGNIEVGFPFDAVANELEGLTYAIGDTLVIEELSVIVVGAESIVGGPGEDTFVINATPVSPAMELWSASSGVEIVSGGGVSDHLDFSGNMSFDGLVLDSSSTVTVNMDDTGIVLHHTTLGGDIDLSDVIYEVDFGNPDVVTTISAGTLDLDNLVEPESDTSNSRVRSGGGMFNIPFLAVFFALYCLRQKKINCREISLI